MNVLFAAAILLGILVVAVIWLSRWHQYREPDEATTIDPSENEERLARLTLDELQ